MTEKTDRAAIAAGIGWLLDRPKTMLVIIGLLGGTGLVREGSRFVTGEVTHATVAIDEAKVRSVLKEEMAPVIASQIDMNRRLGNIESALINKGLQADAAPWMKP